MKIAAVHLQTIVNEVAAKIVVENGVDWGNPAEQDSHSHRFGVLHGSNRFPCLKHNNHVKRIACILRCWRKTLMTPMRN